MVKAPAAMHAVYPTGRPPFDFARIFDEPELKTFEERQKDKRKNQEKELQRLGEPAGGGEGLRSGVEASRSGGAPPAPDAPLQALAPVARGEVPLVFRADAEDDIRGRREVRGRARAQAHHRGRPGGVALRAELKEKDVAVLVNVDRLPARETDPYDAAYANPAALQQAGVRFAIVSDDASQSRNLPYEAAMARAFGLPADAALRAITLSPAEIFGVADRLGSITVGKAANLFLATGDIMDARTQVTDVIVDGMPQSMENRHTRLYQQFKDR